MVITNEFIFGIHCLLVVTCSLIALRMGKSALISWMAVQAVLANLFVAKQISLCGLTVTGSEVFAVGCILSFNLLQEYWDRSVAKQATYIVFGILIAYLLLTQIHLWYLPSVFDGAHEHYAPLLATMPRLVAASFISYITVQTWDMYFYRALKQLARGRFFVVRSAISLIIAQLLDTVLFTFIGLYGTVHAPLDIIVMCFAIKVIAVLISVPLVGISKQLILRHTTADINASGEISSS